MITNWWLTLFGCLEMAALAYALVAIVRSNITSRYPSLVWAVSFELAVDIALMSLMHPPRAYAVYFYIYWASIAVQAGLRLWVLGDVLRSFTTRDIFPNFVYLFIGIAGLTMAVGSAFFCFHTTTSLIQDGVGTVIMLDRCVNIGWVTFFAVMLGATKFLGFIWDPLGARIAAGVATRICGLSIVGELIVHSSQAVRLWANALDSTCSIAVFLFWALHIHSSSLAPSTDSEPESYAVRLSADTILGLASHRER